MLHYFMINFIKKNWAVIILLLIVLLWIKNTYSVQNLSINSTKNNSLMSDMAYAPSAGSSFGGSAKISLFPSGSSVAPSESTSRIVIQDTGLSLQVKDVSKTINEIEETTKTLGGFLINSNLTKPDTAANGSISIRIPEDKRKQAMEAFKSMAVKVVSESVSGTDVTDQYMDIDARIEVLNKTKTKYEDILQKAEKVNDLMNVQQELINLQSQIDSLKGQQKYYEQSAKLSKIVIYLSTDELALPYAPTNEWRPAVVFKEAVRSLVGMFRGIGSLIIWAIVYIPILIPIILVIFYLKKRSNKLSTN